MRKIVLLAPFVVLVLAFACGDGDDRDGEVVESTATQEGVASATATPEGPEAQVPQEIIDAINVYIAGGSAPSQESPPGLDQTLVLDEDCLLGGMGDLCVDLGPPTVVSEDDATIVFFTPQSDSSWEITLTKRDDAWTVNRLTFTGCC